MSVLRGVLLGTASSYVKIVTRAACGMATFRLLREGLGDEHFGFWVLLWSTFGFMMLVDFGLGMTIQRTVARASGQGTPEARAEVGVAVATVFWIGALVTLALAAGAWAVGGHLLSYLFAQSGIVDGAARAEMRGAATMFAVAVFGSYPFGMYREVLRGQHRIYVADGIDVVGILAQTALVVWGRWSGWGISGYMTAAVATTVGPVLLIALVVMRDRAMIPDPRRFSRADLKRLGSFSSYIYFSSMANLVTWRTDALLIGRFLSLTSVAWYAPGQKVAEMYSMLTQQMQGMLGSASAHLDARTADPEQRRAALARLLLVSQRWAALIAVSLAVPLACDLPGALRVLNGRASLIDESFVVAWLLVGGTAIGVIGSSCARAVLLQTGHHRASLCFAIAEAVLKVGASLVMLSSWRSITAVAIASAGAAAVMHLLVVPVYAHRAFALRWRDTAAATGRGLAGATGAALAGWLWWRVDPLASPTWNFVAGCGVVCAAMAPTWWWLGMLPDERARMRGWIGRLRGR